MSIPTQIDAECPLDDAFVAFISGELDVLERRRIESHLDVCDACSELLAQLARSPLVSLASDAPLEAAPMLPRRLVRGESVGRYVVVRELGAGGMGVVYIARDPDLDREVALKLLRPRLADGPSGHARLLAEARTLAAVSHRNVVQVFDVGTHDEQVFVAMELVDGLNLRQWKTRKQPTWREALRVCIEAGRGLAAVHVAGINHRDVKPSNVLVATEGRVVLIDFGLAGAPTRTPSRDVVGTPGYIAPELLTGAPPDPRGDQFAFCVLVHETIFGERPFDDAGREIEIDRASTPPSLHAALARGLAARPEDRFPSMDALLAELVPIVSPRRRWPVVAIGVLALGSIAAVALTSRAPTRCEAAEPRVAATWGDRKAEVEQAFTATGLSFAGPTFVRVAAELDRWTETWVAEYAAACEQAGPELDARMACLERDRRRVGTLVDVLAAADRGVVVEASAIASALPDVASCRAGAVASTDPRVEEAYDRIARAEAELAAGRFESASLLAAEAHAIAAGIDDARLRTAADLTHGRVAAKAGALDLADTRLQAAVAGAESIGDDTTAVRALLELVWRDGYSRVELDAARHHARHAEAMLQRLPDPGVLAANLEYRKGWLELMAGDPGRAEPHFRAALAGHVDAFDRAADHSAIGAALLQLGDQEAADRELELGRALGESALGPTHPDLVPLMNNIAASQRLAGALEAADATYRKLVAIAIEAHGEQHVLVGRLRLNLGTVLTDRGRLDDAYAEFERAGAVLEAAVGAEHPDVARALDGRAQVLHNKGALEDAILLYERALAIRQAALGDDHPSLALSLTNIGLLRAKAGRAAEALAPLRRGAELVEAAYGEGEQLATALGSLAGALVDVGEIDEATRTYDRAIAIGERVRAADLGSHLTGRAEIHDDPAEAEALLRRALEQWAIQEGEDPVHEGYTRYALAQTLTRLGRANEAAQEGRRALQYVVDADPDKHAEIRRWLEGQNQSGG
jgi:tetratricopeptide (TPR) repeat protein/predicted Ser/Thr protein kinase